MRQTAYAPDLVAHIPAAAVAPYRLQFKIATLMHQIYHRHCPQYLVNVVSFTSDATGQRLRSTATRAAVSVRTHTNLVRRAFSVAGPSAWNSSLSSLKLIDSHKQFRRQLKTYYFNVSFSQF